MFVYITPPSRVPPSMNSFTSKHPRRVQNQQEFVDCERSLLGNAFSVVMFNAILRVLATMLNKNNYINKGTALRSGGLVRDLETVDKNRVMCILNTFRKGRTKVTPYTFEMSQKLATLCSIISQTCYGNVSLKAKKRMPSFSPG